MHNSLYTIEVIGTNDAAAPGKLPCLRDEAISFSYIFILFF